MTSAPVELGGARVRVRPIRSDEADRYIEGFGGPVPGGIPDEPSIASPISRPAREVLLKRVETSGRFVDAHLELAVEADGSFAGSIQARNPQPCFPPGVFMIGIGLAPEYRGRGVGREAMALLTSYLFEHEGAERVEASTDVENVPMRTVNDRLGFVMEGVLRSFMPLGDERRDYCMYAMTRDDWEKSKDRWTFPS